VTVIAAARFRVGGVTYASSWLSLPAKPSTKPIRHPADVGCERVRHVGAIQRDADVGDRYVR